ncbi:MAG: hypothetical protein IJH12_04095 [Clostridia bacterium]|nr:hypothetical protein [Clostridia bacterium]
MSDAKNGDVELGKETAGGNKKKIAIIGGIVAAVIVVIFLIAAILGGGYKTPIKNYYTGLQKANSKTYLKAFPEFLREDLEDTYTDEKLEDKKESLEDTYGDKLKISYKVIDKTKLTKDEIKDAQKALKALYDDEKIKVTAGYNVAVKVTKKGTDKKATEYTSFEIYKINGKWCMMPSTY